MTPGTSDWVGEVLSGRYKVLSQLGEGGMGFVYRARDGNLDCEVVVKVPRRSLLEDPEFAARFTREVRSLVRLVHPHIVKVQDVGQHDGLPFAVMQYLPGGSLRDRQPRGSDGTPRPLPPESLREWLPGVAGALDFIHQQRYIHRDVKPDNILFDAHGFPFLSDFGVAKVVADNSERRQKTVLTGAGMVLGTPQYMAPELLLGQGYDGRVDQYALAVMLYELLSGRYPFDGSTSTAIFVKQTTEEPPPLQLLVPSMPPQLAAAIHKALAKEPSARFADCTSFAQAVIEACAVPTSSARSGPETTAPAEVEARKAPCPNCHKKFTVPPGAWGKRVRCPACGKPFRVPSAPAGPGYTVAETRPVLPGQKETRVRTPFRSAARVEAVEATAEGPVRSRRTWWPAAIAAAVGVCVVGGALLAIFVAGRKPAAEPAPAQTPPQELAAKATPTPPPSEPTPAPQPSTSTPAVDQQETGESPPKEEAEPTNRAPEMPAGPVRIAPPPRRIIPNPAPRPVVRPPSFQQQVLFDGKNLNAWMPVRENQPIRWRIVNGFLEVKPGTGHLRTKQEFADDQEVHVEFWLPYMPRAHGQAKANSGVLLLGRYEIQILDSSQQPISGPQDCGALYGQIAPLVNACSPPRKWQTFDITFRVPKFDENGRLAEPGQLTVHQNRQLVLDKVEVRRPTLGAPFPSTRQPSPLVLQEHGSPVLFRNIWIKPLEPE
jgi:serine/threonine-protein kinase